MEFLVKKKVSLLEMLSLFYCFLNELNTIVDLKVSAWLDTMLGDTEITWEPTQFVLNIVIIITDRKR